MNKPEIEKLALEEYPEILESIDGESEWDKNKQYRDCWIEGYKKASPELIDALMKLIFLNQCELEGIQSGMPSSDDWREAFEKAEQALLKSGCYE